MQLCFAQGQPLDGLDALTSRCGVGVSLAGGPGVAVSRVGDFSEGAGGLGSRVQLCQA